MAHGTLINGVQRNITGGFTLVNGVERKITKGLTLVNGVQREIDLSQGCVITITGSGSSWTYVSVNEVKYMSATTLEVEPGTVIYCYVKYTAWGYGSIYLNGELVAFANDDNPERTYQYTVQGNISIRLDGDGDVNIYITEE